MPQTPIVSFCWTYFVETNLFLLDLKKRIIYVWCKIISTDLYILPLLPRVQGTEYYEAQSDFGIHFMNIRWLSKPLNQEIFVTPDEIEGFKIESSLFCFDLISLNYVEFDLPSFLLTSWSLHIAFTFLFTVSFTLIFTFPILSVLHVSLSKQIFTQRPAYQRSLVDDMDSEQYLLSFVSFEDIQLPTTPMCLAPSQSMWTLPLHHSTTPPSPPDW